MKSAEQEQEQKVEEIPQAENLPPVEIPKVESASAEISKVEPAIASSSAEATKDRKATEDKQTQEISSQPEIKMVEKIIYKTDPLIVADTPTGTANFVQKLLIKARAKIQERKRKKLDKIMSLFETKTELSNSDVRKLLRTARRSAVRYLDILEKEQKITQIGNIGKGVRYTKKQ